MIEDTLKNFKEKIANYEYKTEFIYFEFTDLEKIYSLNNCSEIENIKEKNKIYFIHLNHTNPLLNEQSKQYKSVITKGYNVAKEEMILDL